MLASARQEDLVRILDDLSGRADRLRQEVTELTAARERLTSGGGRRRRPWPRPGAGPRCSACWPAPSPASGPGRRAHGRATRSGAVRADVLLDALEELRDAGAEAVQLGGRTRRAGAAGPGRRQHRAASTDRGGVTVDGVPLAAPYSFTVIGDPGTLASALGIPGGVVDDRRAGWAGPPG